MRRPPPPHPRGTPRTPGSGRRKGSLNRRTVEMRELMTALCGDVDYQYRLRADFRHRRVPPTIEALVWAHTIGKPTERVHLSADVAMTQALQKEVELFGRLSVQEMEIIAAESQRLVDKAMAMARANSAPPVPATVGRAPEAITGTPGPKETGDDVTSSELDGPLDRTCVQAAAQEPGEPTWATGRLRTRRPGWRPECRPPRVADEQDRLGTEAGPRDTVGRHRPR